MGCSSVLFALNSVLNDVGAACVQSVVLVSFGCRSCLAEGAERGQRDMMFVTLPLLWTRWSSLEAQSLSTATSKSDEVSCTRFLSLPALF